MNDEYKQHFDETLKAYENLQLAFDKQLNNCLAFRHGNNKQDIKEMVTEALEMMAMLYVYTLEMDQILFFEHKNNPKMWRKLLKNLISKSFVISCQENITMLKNCLQQDDSAYNAIHLKVIEKYHLLFVQIIEQYLDFYYPEIQFLIDCFLDLKQKPSLQKVSDIKVLTTEFLLLASFFDDLLYQLKSDHILDEAYVDEFSLFETGRILNDFVLNLLSQI